MRNSLLSFPRKRKNAIRDLEGKLQKLTIWKIPNKLDK
jgi:hypothetical protein